MRQDASISRRFAVQGTAVAGVALLVGGAGFEATSAHAEDGSAEEIEETQYGFLVDTANCVNCRECVKACVRYNGTADGTARREVVAYESSFGTTAHVSLGCMHCGDPSCLKVCPAGAIAKRPDGIVVVDSERCIGCKYCYQACPFGVPHYGSNGMDKCDCCLGSGIAAGDAPRCVQACAFDALVFGKLPELQANKAYKGAHQVEASTKPSYLIR